MKYLLVISERGHSWAGRPPSKFAHDTREEAEAALREYVERNWDSEMGTERPNDNEENIVEQYFADVLERYEILEVE